MINIPDFVSVAVICEPDDPALNHNLKKLSHFIGRLKQNNIEIYAVHRHSYQSLRLIEKFPSIKHCRVPYRVQMTNSFMVRFFLRKARHDKIIVIMPHAIVSLFDLQLIANNLSSDNFVFINARLYINGNAKYHPVKKVFRYLKYIHTLSFHQTKNIISFWGMSEPSLFGLRKRAFTEIYKTLSPAKKKLLLKENNIYPLKLLWQKFSIQQFLSKESTQVIEGNTRRMILSHDKICASPLELVAMLKNIIHFHYFPYGISWKRFLLPVTQLAYVSIPLAIYFYSRLWYIFMIYMALLILPFLKHRGKIYFRSVLLTLYRILIIPFL